MCRKWGFVLAVAAWGCGDAAESVEDDGASTTETPPTEEAGTSGSGSQTETGRLTDGPLVTSATTDATTSGTTSGTTGGTTGGTAGGTTGGTAESGSSTGFPELDVCDEVPFAGGSGTEEDPYQICSLRQLRNIETELDAHFELLRDLDFSDGGVRDGIDPITGWDPIGTGDEPFAGTLQGNEHTLSNLEIDVNETYVGLFASIDGPALVENLAVIDASVTGNDYVGVIAGRLANQATVRLSSSSGDVHGTWGTGGLAGSCSSCTIERSWTTASVEGSGSWATGGLVGFLAGGLVGQPSPRILDSYARGSVQGNIRVGGLVGWRVIGTIHNTYAAGTLTGESLVGGLVGDSSNPSPTESSYWDTDVSGQLTSASGEPRTSLELHVADTFVDWNFEEIWCIDPLTNGGYPTLRDPAGGCL